TAETLENGAVLAVDGDDLSAAPTGGVENQLAGHHEAFLVGQRHTLSAFQRRQRRIESCRADDRVEHDVDVVARRGLDEAGIAAVPGRGPFGSILDETDERRTEFGRLLA